MDESGSRLTSLTTGQQIPYGGDRVAVVDADLAERFRAGDRLVVVQQTGDLLLIPEAEHHLVAEGVTRALGAFAELSSCSDESISEFLRGFADRLEDRDVIAAIERANRADIDDAVARGRTTGRLLLDDKMRTQMIAGLRSWASGPDRRDLTVHDVAHTGWSVEVRRAPVGVVGFVFEGRPNVFADAVGVVCSGNTVVVRIGSDALRTAVALMERALSPALEAAGLPSDTVVLLDSPSRAVGWALFNDARLSLAVARGSGAAVAQLGAVARQSGVAVSLHGTGGAWMIATEAADARRLFSSIVHSLDRKVCNTLNVLCLTEQSLSVTAEPALEALGHCGALVHLDPASLDALRRSGADLDDAAVVEGLGLAGVISSDALDLGREWEWDDVPELSLIVVGDLDSSITLFNRHSPRFVASLISERDVEHEHFYGGVEAPFVGDGFTRWVDGQYVFETPELGLSNWERGRLLGRSAVVSGDSVHTLRLRARIDDADTHR
jgi:glutamate-5-semialdehyde dehydrogenase